MNNKNYLNIIGIIPARMGSTRFPGKPLETILGIPMIEHVWRRIKMSKNLLETYVATCDTEIKEYIENIGGKVVMTKDTHKRCTDRTVEALSKIEKYKKEKIDIVVMIQGDEPMLVPEMIDMAVKPLLEDSSINVVNLMAPIKSAKEHNDPNCPKVVVDKNNFALYFSREPIPSRKKWSGEDYSMYKQVCVIPFTRDYLLKYSSMSPSMLEEVESIDMNRILENGDKIKMVYEEFETYCVDTPEDLKKVENLMKNDILIKKYEN